MVSNLEKISFKKFLELKVELEFGWNLLFLLLIFIIFLHIRAKYSSFAMSNLQLCLDYEITTSAQKHFRFLINFLYISWILTSLQVANSIRMEVKIFLLLLFAKSFYCGSEIPDFLGRLIKDLKVNKPSQVHDVVLVSLEAENKELIEQIAEVISKENVVLMPPTGVVTNNQRIRSASVLIIVSSIIDEVIIK